VIRMDAMFAHLPPDLFPGDWPVMLRGPFTVEWDSVPVAIGVDMRLELDLNEPVARWFDGLRWHFMPYDFLGGMIVDNRTVLFVEAIGSTVRQVTIRPVKLEDQALLIPNPEAATVGELIARIRATWSQLVS